MASFSEYGSHQSRINTYWSNIRLHLPSVFEFLNNFVLCNCQVFSYCLACSWWLLNGSVLVSLGCCNHVPWARRLKQHKSVIPRFWRTEAQDQGHDGPWVLRKTPFHASHLAASGGLLTITDICQPRETWSPSLRDASAAPVYLSI